MYPLYLLYLLYLLYHALAKSSNTYFNIAKML